MKKFLLSLTFFSIIMLIVIELFFRLVLPASEWPRGVVLDTGIRRFDSSSFTSGTFSYGRYCRGRYRWSINSQGWNSIYDYTSLQDRNSLPMIAVLGDSYLEGFYSDVENHVDCFLTDSFNDSVGFYTFAMSGGFISHYISLMKYEIEQYQPSGYIIFMNSSDISKSMVSLGGKHPYYFQFEPDGSGSWNEVRPDYVTRSSIKDIILHSALARYLKANAQVSLGGAGLADENANFEDTSSTFTGLSATELNEASAFLLRELNSFERPVLIVADCPKNWIYLGGEEEIYEDVAAVRELVDCYTNVTLVELAGYYTAEYSRFGRRFSPEDNPHWDAYTNSFIAEILTP